MVSDNYLYVRVLVGVLIQKDNKFLLVQEATPKVYAQWGLPGGRIEVGHNLEDTAVRETKEEVGYDVVLDRQLGVFHERFDRPVHHVFLAHISGGELAFPQEELMDARWLTFEEIRELEDKLRFPWLVDLVANLKSRADN